jgi:1-phosphofructokinase family hexose kinase
MPEPFILTVTPNTGLDHVLFLDRLRLGARNQALASAVCMGGKGTDVSLILARMGVSSVATGFAAGETGGRMERMLAEAGVRTAFLPVEGQTRVNTVLIERETGTHTTVCAEGLRVATAELEALRASVADLLSTRPSGTAAVAVFAGSLPEGAPADAYVPLIETARAAGALTILDTSGRYLAEALRAAPWAVKPNREELESLAGRPIATPAEAIAAARALLVRGVRRVVASLGAAGAVAVEGDAAWVAEPLPVTSVSPAGAGDGMVAAMSLGAAHGWDLPRTLREAVATATAVVVTPGTAECDVARLPDFRKRVVVRAWAEEFR